MILWINGCFGVGKTSISEKLHEQIKDSFIYDPEITGEFIWKNSPNCISRKGDFQDIPMWRDINYQMLKHIYNNYTGTIIVPMTLVNKEYYNQIITRLINDGVDIQHYILMAEKSTILKRLIKRGEVDNSWAEMQIDRCQAAYEKDIDGIKIESDNKSIKEITNTILKQI